MTAGGRGSVVTRSRRGMNLTTRGGGMLDRNPVTISTEEDSEEIYLDALSDGNREAVHQQADQRARTGRFEPPPKH